MGKVTNVSIERFGGVDLKVNYQFQVEREVFYPVVKGTWMGKEYTVTMNCQRYPDHPSPNGWRMYAEHVSYPDSLSPTAKERFVEASFGMVLERVEQEYEQARRAWFYNMLRRSVLEISSRHSHADTELKLERVRNEITSGQAQRIENALAFMGMVLDKLEEE